MCISDGISQTGCVLLDLCMVHWMVHKGYRMDQTFCHPQCHPEAGGVN